MSNNKYIINEESLVGIADQVRDLLGAEAASIDETTGDIIYPENKGYYVLPSLACSFNTYGIGNYLFFYMAAHNNNISWETNIVNWCGETPKYIKFKILRSPNAPVYFCYGKSNRQLLFNTGVAANSEITISYIPFTSGTQNRIEYSSTSSPYPTFEISFLDEDKNVYPIQNEDTGFIFYTGNTQYPISFLQKVSFSPSNLKPIPLSIENIISGISKRERIALIPSFFIDSTYNGNSTVLPKEIKAMTDIKKLVMITSHSSNTYGYALLEPATAETASYSMIGGVIPKSGTVYRMRTQSIYTNTGQLSDTWEEDFQQSSGYYDIYFWAEQRKLLVVSSNAITAVYFPAVLIY